MKGLALFTAAATALVTPPANAAAAAPGAATAPAAKTCDAPPQPDPTAVSPQAGSTMRMPLRPVYR